MKSNNVTAVTIFAIAAAAGVAIYWLGRGTSPDQASLGVCLAALILGAAGAASIAGNQAESPKDEASTE